MRTGYLLEREVGHVLAALTPSNRLVCRVCLHTGLRVGDVLALRTQQLAPHFWVVERKTGKRRQVGLPAGLLRDIRAQAGEVWALVQSAPGVLQVREVSLRCAGSGCYQNREGDILLPRRAIPRLRALHLERLPWREGAR